MKKIFISWYDGFLNQFALNYYNSLIMNYSVETSPFSTECGRGHDPKWDNWYDYRCKSLIENSDIYIAIITNSWSGSTWMLHEISTANNCAKINIKPKRFYLILEDTVIDNGLKHELRNFIKLPENIELSKIIIEKNY